MLISSQSSIKQEQEQHKDYRSAVLNAVRTFNMTIMGTYSELFKKDFNEDELNEKIALFASAFIVEYSDDGICYAITHHDVTIWISTDETLPNTTDEITEMVFDYYESLVSEANKIRKKLK